MFGPVESLMWTLVRTVDDCFTGWRAVFHRATARQPVNVTQPCTRAVT
jgi:hypothetical protein